MNLPRGQRETEDGPRRTCIECGSQYRPSDHGYRLRWCSTSCESESLRRQRDEIEDTWMRARWFQR